MVTKFFNSILDKSIYFCFDSSGFKRHAKDFEPIDFNTIDSEVLITGGTDGIGKAVALELLENNKSVTILGRDPAKFIDHPNAHCIQLDLANYQQIVEFSKQTKKIKYLVLNAGGMPSELTFNSYQHEYQLASQLLGHFLLFSILHKNEKLANNAKIIITSSGGMLLKKLDLDDLINPRKYDKVQTYANVKRAQVIMIEEFSKKFSQYHWASMHPGWVETKAVIESLPGFYQFTKNRLRTPKQGADTILWLLATDFRSNGHFWFDRKIAHQYPLKKFQESKEERKELVKFVENFLVRFS